MIAKYDEPPVDIQIDRSPVLSVAYKFKWDHVLMLDKSYGYPMNRQDSGTQDSDRGSHHLLECTRPVAYLVSH
jgi:hypothetical protein